MIMLALFSSPSENFVSRLTVFDMLSAKNKNERKKPITLGLCGPQAGSWSRRNYKVMPLIEDHANFRIIKFEDPHELARHDEKLFNLYSRGIWGFSSRNDGLFKLQKTRGWPFRHGWSSSFETSKQDAKSSKSHSMGAMSMRLHCPQ